MFKNYPKKFDLCSIMMIMYQLAHAYSISLFGSFNTVLICYVLIFSVFSCSGDVLLVFSFTLLAIVSLSSDVVLLVFSFTLCAIALTLLCFVFMPYFKVLIFLSLQMTWCLSFRLFMHCCYGFLQLFLYLHMLVCLDVGLNTIVSVTYN